MTRGPALDGIVDTHCHLDVAPLARATPEAPLDLSLAAQRLAEARARGVLRVIVPAIDPPSFDGLVTLAHASPGVDFALGVHPVALPAWTDEALADALARVHRDAPSLRASGLVAIGECGLDGVVAREAGGELDRQRRWLAAHVALAESLALPLVVHVHRAMDAALAFFESHGPLRAGLVLHAYGGPAALVPRWVALGARFGIGPAITRPGARRPLEAARAIPLERLLLETDAPENFASSEASRVGAPAQSADVLVALATLRGMSTHELARRTTANATEVFGAARGELVARPS